MHKGRCLCDEIEFAVEGQPSDVIDCHCTFCQRATGSAYLVETLFERQRFKLLRGTPKVFAHVSEGSGKLVHIHFCGTCGTKTHMLFERFPESVGVFSGTFDEKGWFERRPDNTRHFFLSAAAAGTVLPAGYEVYDAHYWASAGVAAKPQVFEAHTLVTEELRDESRGRLGDLEA